MTAPASQPGPTRHPTRGWMHRWLLPLRRTSLVLIGLLLLEYVVVPQLVGAGRNLTLLGRLQPGWLAAGVVAELLALAAYAMLLRAVLPAPRLGIWRVIRIVLASTGFAHVVPAGAAGSAGVGFRLLTTSGVASTDAGFTLATAALGSAVVLNLLLWPSLIISIPIAGLHPIYVTTALVGLVGLGLTAAIIYTFTRGEERAVRIVRSIGARIPRVGADRLEQVVRDMAQSLGELSHRPKVLIRASGWAAANWLLDAASLWCFLAALGRYAEPTELFTAYGIANVLAVIPITPGGLGVIDAIVPALLVSTGFARTVATLGVLGWRLVNYWLPIPIGGIAYLSLRDRSTRQRGPRQLTRRPDPSAHRKMTDEQ